MDDTRRKFAVTYIPEIQTMKTAILGLTAAILCLAPFASANIAQAGGPQAALLYTEMKGVPDDKKDEFWGYTRKVLSQHYTLLEDERVLSASAKAKAEGCEADACLQAVKKATGAAVTLQLTHVYEGYFHQLYLTRLDDGGAVQKHYTCYLCGPKEFQATLNRLANRFEEGD